MFAFPLAPTQIPTPPTLITEGFVIGEVSAPGRRPAPDDAIVEQLVSGQFMFPSEGTEVKFHGKIRKWHSVHAGKDGSFDDPALENGYLAVQVNEDQATDLILNVKGDSLVYVNGVPRAGDPYSYGYLNLPVHFHQGENQLLFVAGRGRISPQLMPLIKPICLQSSDATLPDSLTNEVGPLDASVVASNATPDFTKGVDLKVISSPTKILITHADPIPPYSSRKLAFRIPVDPTWKLGKHDISVQLVRSGKVIDQIPLSIQVKKPSDLQKRTFLSTIDGSVQYYAAWPATKPSPSNALVLTLHGAGVEGYGQAAAYAPKEWATIVAPTNRRPYGFDWEGVGRLDALEVLSLAKKQFLHNPYRIDLTGHSMGGHGTWSIGTLYPNLFASIAPSAGWISFWSYAGGWNPSVTNPALTLMRRAMNVGDTLGRVDNTLSENVYILHGDLDDNVPVQQARTMKAQLEAIHHSNIQYHEQPGANHWWGNQCVDWPPIFKMIENSKLDPNADHVDFTTQSPVVSSQDRWIKIDQQEECLAPSHVIADRTSEGNVQLTTSNVAELEILELTSHASVKIDGQAVSGTGSKESTYHKVGDHWVPTHPLPAEKSSERGSGFKQVFNRRFAFIVGTHGTVEENEWALSRAIYDAEMMEYRGNGAVEIVLDYEYSPRKFNKRNLILFGNSTTNSVWPALLRNCPVSLEGKANTGALLIFPKPGESNTLVGAITGSDLSGMKRTDRLLLFSSGVDYPDWIMFDSNSPDGVAQAGFFDNQWKLDPRQSGSASHN